MFGPQRKSMNRKSIHFWYIKVSSYKVYSIAGVNEPLVPESHKGGHHLRQNTADG